MWFKFILACPFIFWVTKMKRCKLKYSGRENVPRQGPFIVVSNHQSTLDYFIVGMAMKKTVMRKRMVPWAKVEIAQGEEGLLGRFLWHWLGTIPIKRRESGEMKKAIRLSLDYLGKGQIVYIFPEGTRYPRGELGSFKPGVSNLVRLSPVPILPVAVYRREDDDGLQVNIGEPFFMPEKKRLAAEDRGESVEKRLLEQIDAVERLNANMPGDGESMKMITSLVDFITANASHPEVDFDGLCRMSDKYDNLYIQDRVFALLPDGWSKVSMN